VLAALIKSLFQFLKMICRYVNVLLKLQNSAIYHKNTKYNHNIIHFFYSSLNILCVYIFVYNSRLKQILTKIINYYYYYILNKLKVCFHFI